MTHAEIPQDKKEHLEVILAGLEGNKFADANEARHNFREILADLALQGHYAREYFQRYKNLVKGISAGMLMSLSLVAPSYAGEKPKPISIEHVCQPTIRNNRLVEEHYEIYERDGQKLIFKVKENVVKQNAQPQDIVGYRCKKNG